MESILTFIRIKENVTYEIKTLTDENQNSKKCLFISHTRSLAERIVIYAINKGNFAVSYIRGWVDWADGHDQELFLNLDEVKEYIIKFYRDRGIPFNDVNSINFILED